jgi:hypothetical protein
MVLRRQLVLCLGALFAMGAQSRTTNFVVEAPTPQIAQQIGQYAEHYRKEKALLWLGREMPTWPEPLPIRVTVTMNGAGGATSFAFDHGRILSQHMHIEGSLDRLLASVLPHEVTHTVFAHHFRCPVPRWADEGGAVLSEDDAERNRHDMLCRQLLNSPGQSIQLRALFGLRDYPQNVMALYAEGYSVSNFLVEQSSRPAFLNFVYSGMTEGWDKACQGHYHYRSVEELEQAWLNHLRDQRRPPAVLASNTAPTPGEAGQRILVRQTVPPAQPILTGASPIYRGVPPTPEQEGQRFGDQVPPGGRPATMPPIQVPEAAWQPAPTPQVILMPPQFPGQAQ